MNRIEQLLQFLTTNPDDNFLQHALALEYIKIGKDADARKTFESLLNRDADYVASYYHLAALLVRSGEDKLAKEWYEKGMAAAKKARDNHSYNELQSAFEDLAD